MRKLKYLIPIFSILIIIFAGYTIYEQNPSVKLNNYIHAYNAKTLVSKCKGVLISGEDNATSARGCYVKYFEAVFDKYGPAYSVNELVSWAAQTNGLDGECHNVGHLLGQYAWNKVGRKAFLGDMTACAFSYGHGILQSATKVIPKTEITTRFRGLCSKTTDVPGCLHGYGHALQDLKYSDVDSAQQCYIEAGLANKTMDTSATKDDRAQTCMEGWSMEDFALRNLFWITIDDPQVAMNTCKGLTGATWAGCAGSAMRNFIVAPDPIHDKNAIQKRIARLTWFKNYCDKLTDSDIQRRCMNYVGLTTAEVYTLDMPNSYTAPNAEKMCDGINVIQCYSALINSRWNRL